MQYVQNYAFNKDASGVPPPPPMGGGGDMSGAGGYGWFCNSVFINFR